MNLSTGFFILEISVAIFVIMLLVVMVWPFLWFRDQLGAQHDMQVLYNSVMYLHQRAKSNFKLKSLEFDQKNRSFKYNNQSHTLSSGVEFGSIPDIKGPPSSPKKQIDNPITFEGNKILFYPDGAISAGTVYLVDKKKHQIFALSISVSYISFIRKYKYVPKSGWQQIE